MATLYVRNVPDELYERLRARASAGGRTIGGEALAILERGLEEDDRAELLAELERLRGAIRLPPGAPTPEEIIREARDSR